MYNVHLPFSRHQDTGKHAASLLAQEVQLAGEAAEEARKNRSWAEIPVWAEVPVWLWMRHWGVFLSLSWNVKNFRDSSGVGS